MRLLVKWRYLCKWNIAPLYLLVYLLFSVVIFVLFLLQNSNEVQYSFVNRTSLEKTTTTTEQKHENTMKFILLWTKPSASPFVYFGTGQTVFKNKSCRYSNCYVTGNRDFLGNYAFFDAVLFNGPQLPHLARFTDFPRLRSPRQKYVYANIESAANYPICSKAWNGYFNWTWTYRLDSDVIWNYFVVKDATGTVVSPKKNPEWLHEDKMDGIDDQLKNKLKNKTKAMAWFVSNCNTQSYREDYVSRVRALLRNISLDVDVYGKCGDHYCPISINQRCLDLLERDYYFYLAFENSISVDYVTEKIMYAYNHNTVPVVFGGADYSRFLPSGSYLNAYAMEPEELVIKVNELITNPQQYYKYFRWKKYYSFHFKHQSPDTDDYCNFCALLNNENLMQNTSVHGDLDVWWNDKTICQKTSNSIFKTWLHK